MTDARERALQAVLSARDLLARKVASVHPTAPQPSAVWRARWGAVSLSVLLIAVDREKSEAVAVPATFEEEGGVPGTAEVELAHTAFPKTLTVWFDQKGRLPFRVLDAPLFELPLSPELDTLEATAKPLRYTSPLDARRLRAAQVGDLFDQLRDADWVPHSDGSLATEVEGLLVPALMSALGSSLAVALAVKRGTRPITSAQAEALSELLGRPADELLSTNPTLPERFVRALDDPSRRHGVEREVRRRGLDAGEARRALAFDAYALAARAPGTSEPDWDAIIDAYLEHVRDE